MRLSTHRVIQLSELAYGCRCEAATNTRAAAKAASINNRGAIRYFINRASRLNLISIRAAQRLAQGA